MKSKQLEPKQSKLELITAYAFLFMILAIAALSLYIGISLGIHSMTSEEFIVQVPCIDKNNNPINGVTCDENILCGGKMKWVESSLCLEVRGRK